MSEDRCVCCGEIIAEGRMICERCEVSGEEITRRLTDRIALLEEKLKYHETTIRMIHANAVQEESKAAKAEAEAIMYANPADQIAMYHTKRCERRRNVEQIQSVCRLRNFKLEKS